MDKISTTAMPPLIWLKSFEAAARLSSFTAAAAELALTQAAVSQHIGLLESHLKTALFTRMARGVQLTPQGAAYLPHIQSAFGTIGRSTAELFTPRASLRVTLRSPISFAALMLAPAIPALSAALPHIQLDITTIHKPSDHDEPGAELDIRFGNGWFAGRHGKRLTRERLVPICLPRLASRENWTTLPLLTVAGAREMWGEWFAAAGMAGTRGQGSHRFDSFIAAMEAARHGAGIVLGSRPLVDAALSGGVLVALSPFELESGAGHFLTRPTGRQLSTAQEDVWSWLTTWMRPDGSK